MSKLQDLIQKLCPDGVEYKKLGDVCELSRGKVYSKYTLLKMRGNIQYILHRQQIMEN